MITGSGCSSHHTRAVLLLFQSNKEWNELNRLYKMSLHAVELQLPFTRLLRTKPESWTGCSTNTYTCQGCTYFWPYSGRWVGRMMPGFGLLGEKNYDLFIQILEIMLKWNTDPSKARTVPLEPHLQIIKGMLAAWKILKI